MKLMSSKMMYCMGKMRVLQMKLLTGIIRSIIGVMIHQIISDRFAMGAISCLALQLNRFQFSISNFFM